MPLLTSIQSFNNFKRESTSQTYGQLVIFPSRQDSAPTDPKSVVQSPRDIVVKLLSANSEPLNLARIVDTERSKISVAAMTPNKQVVINMSAAISADKSFSEAGKQEFANISSVVQNIQDFAIVVGGSKPEAELQSVLKQSIKTDLFITLKSKDSEIVDYNNLKDIQINSKFTYNFYTPEECDVKSQEDQSLDPLLKNSISEVPRFVKLTWDPVNITEQLSTTESDFLRVFPKVSRNSWIW